MPFSFQKMCLKNVISELQPRKTMGTKQLQFFPIKPSAISKLYNIYSTMVERDETIRDEDVDVNFFGYENSDPTDHLKSYIYRWAGAINQLRIKLLDCRKKQIKVFGVKVSLPDGIPFLLKDGKSKKTSSQFRSVTYELNAYSGYPVAGTAKINNIQIQIDQNYSDKPQYQVSHFLGVMVHQQIRFSFLPRYKNWIPESQKMLDKEDKLYEESLLDENYWKWGVPSILIKNKNLGQELFRFMFTNSFRAVYTWWQKSTKQKLSVTPWNLQYNGQNYVVRLYVLVPFIGK